MLYYWLASKYVFLFTMILQLFLFSYIFLIAMDGVFYYFGCQNWHGVLGKIARET